MVLIASGSRGPGTTAAEAALPGLVWTCWRMCQAGGVGHSRLPRHAYECLRCRCLLCRWTPESVGDYASGTNHVLPTYGYARMYSGVSLDSFTKKMTVQSLSYEGLQVLGPHVAKMAEVEGLDAHKRAVTLRLESSS